MEHARQFYVLRQVVSGSGTNYHVTSRPDARMLMALAVPAMVEMNPLGASTCPTSSGNVYVSLACSVLVLTIRLSLLALPAAVTRLTLIVAAVAL